MDHTIIFNLQAVADLCLSTTVLEAARRLGLVSGGLRSIVCGKCRVKSWRYIPKKA